MSNKMFAWLLVTLGSCGLYSAVFLSDSTSGAGMKVGGSVNTASAADALKEVRVVVVSPDRPFQPEKLEAMPGQSFELTLVNTAEERSKFVCDWVLSHPNSVMSVIIEGMNTAGDSGQETYAPPVLAATPRAAPGESKKVVFKAPEDPGEYPFVCTVADHWKRVKGILEVKPAQWPRAWAGEWFDPLPPVDG